MNSKTVCIDLFLFPNFSRLGFLKIGGIGDGPGGVVDSGLHDPERLDFGPTELEFWSAIDQPNINNNKSIKTN